MSNKKLLTKRHLKKALKVLEYFEVTPKETKLTATFDFKSHIEALVFIARITVHAEVNQHHPDIQFSYKKVKFLFRNQRFLIRKFLKYRLLGVPWS